MNLIGFRVVLLSVVFSFVAGCGGVDDSTSGDGGTSASVSSCVHNDSRCTQSCSSCH